MTKKKTDILIVDDEPIIIDAIQKVAEFEGFTTNTTCDANEALERLEKTDFNLIITDIMMPGKNGFEFLEIINKRKITSPVIMTTGFSTLENAVKALNEGAMGFIPKPFAADELTSIILRGMKYKILFKDKFNPGGVEDDLFSFVPCPPRYYRLGFDSWMNEDVEGTVKVGLTDLFLKSIGTFSNIELMNMEETIYQGGSCIRISDTEDSTHQMLSPISGKILSINEKIVNNISLLEKDPYFDGWIYTLVPSNFEKEIENLTPCSSDINGFQITIEKFIQ